MTLAVLMSVIRSLLYMLLYPDSWDIQTLMDPVSANHWQLAMQSLQTCHA